MKSLLLTLAFLVVLKANAQNYLINFTGTNIPVDIVQVKNLTTGDSLILSGINILHLHANISTGIIDTRLEKGMKIYPNPMVSSSTLEFVPLTAGNAVISVFDMNGKLCSQLQSYLDNSDQIFKLSGAGKGFYIVNILGDSYKFSGKLICNGSGGSMNIEKISSNQSIARKELGVSKGSELSQTIDMVYTDGDRLKFTASTGNYRNIMTDIPDKTKTIAFDLIPVIDEDKNNYHTVAIGNQTWMEENLRTTKYNDGSDISMRWDSIPAFAWYDNSKETFKDPYGALYNGFAVNTGNICPAGWHMPTVDEWVSLKDYLTVNDFNYQGELGAIGKSLASKTGWNVPQLISNLHGGYLPIPNGSVGKNPRFNNASGFNGFPGGMRNPDGSFSNIGYTGVWWSSSGISSLWDFSIQNGEYGGNADLIQGSDYRPSAFSVRCIKN
jgi:uncharacterized protein (TIGR02145 family)